MAAHKPKIDPNSPSGRVLQALRAGRMTAGELAERFSGYSSATSSLARRGLITRPSSDGGYFQITDAGRAACPLRNPLAGNVAAPEALAVAARRMSVTPIQPTAAPIPVRSAQTQPTMPPTTAKGEPMEKISATNTKQHKGSTLPRVVRREPAKPKDEIPDGDGIEFSMYNDGRLAISDGDEIFVLPPNATRRLAFFLGCFETDTVQPKAA